MKISAQLVSKNENDHSISKYLCQSPQVSRKVTQKRGWGEQAKKTKQKKKNKPKMSDSKQGSTSK